MENKDYEVGYGKPPKEYQFKKGVSGNKAGRKKKPVPHSLQEAFAIVANEKYALPNRNGVTENLTMYQLLMRAVLQDAVKKDGASRKFILEHFLTIDLLSSYNHLVERQYQAEKHKEHKDDLDPQLKQQMLAILAEIVANRTTELETKIE